MCMLQNYYFWFKQMLSGVFLTIIPDCEDMQSLLKSNKNSSRINVQSLML